MRICAAVGKFVLLLWSRFDAAKGSLQFLIELKFVFEIEGRSAFFYLLLVLLCQFAIEVFFYLIFDKRETSDGL